jgi:hypothetical protein
MRSFPPTLRAVRRMLQAGIAGLPGTSILVCSSPAGGAAFDMLLESSCEPAGRELTVEVYARTNVGVDVCARMRATVA